MLYDRHSTSANRQQITSDPDPELSLPSVYPRMSAVSQHPLSPWTYAVRSLEASDSPSNASLHSSSVLAPAGPPTSAASRPGGSRSSMGKRIVRRGLRRPRNPFSAGVGGWVPPSAGGGRAPTRLCSYATMQVHKSLIRIYANPHYGLCTQRCSCTARSWSTG